jgi:hypothetical protein
MSAMSGTDCNDVFNQLRKAFGKRQRDHAAIRSAHNRGQLPQLQMLHDSTQNLGLVLRGNRGEVGLPGARPGRAAAAAEKVDAKNSIAIAVERATWPDDVTPPAFVARVISHRTSGGNTAQRRYDGRGWIADQSPSDADIGQLAAIAQGQGALQLQHALIHAGTGLGHSIHESKHSVSTPATLEKGRLDRFRASQKPHGGP